MAPFCIPHCLKRVASHCAVKAASAVSSRETPLAKVERSFVTSIPSPRAVLSDWNVARRCFSISIPLPSTLRMSAVVRIGIACSADCCALAAWQAVFAFASQARLSAGGTRSEVLGHEVEVVEAEDRRVEDAARVAAFTTAERERTDVFRRHLLDPRNQRVPCLPVGRRTSGSFAQAASRRPYLRVDPASEVLPEEIALGRLATSTETRSLARFNALWRSSRSGIRTHTLELSRQGVVLLASRTEA